MNEKLEFTCCFCGKKIISDEINPLNLNIMGQFDREALDKPSQDFYSHFECLKSRLHENIRGYFLETNFVFEEGEY